MISSSVISTDSLWLISPLLLYATLAFIALVGGAISPNKAAKGSMWLGILACFSTLGIVVSQWSSLGVENHLLFSEALSIDRFSLFFTGLTAGLTLLVLPLISEYFEGEQMHSAKAYSFLYLCVIGLLLLAMSNNLVLLFIGIELMSLATYPLIGFNRGKYTPIESALKYFISSSFASAILLFGIAMIYGAVGTTSISNIGDLFTGLSSINGVMAQLQGNPLLTPDVLPIGVALLLIGLAFKVGAAPFHMWIPDVYQGAPAPVTAFISTAMTAGAFAAFTRILVQALPALFDFWAPIIATLAALTVVVGNLAAVVQRDVKRMLAYSSVVHGGYAMMGLLTIDPAGRRSDVSGILLYMVAYTAMTLGAFAVVIYLQKKPESEVTDLDSYGGLGFKYPLLGIAMTLFLLSLGGLPPTAGFVAKFNLFTSVIAADYTKLVLLALLSTVASMYYYMRVVVYLYMRPDEGTVSLRPSILPAAVIGLSALTVMLIGLMPSSGPFNFLQWAKDSVLALLA